MAFKSLNAKRGMLVLGSTTTTNLFTHQSIIGVYAQGAPWNYTAGCLFGPASDAHCSASWDAFWAAAQTNAAFNMLDYKCYNNVTVEVAPSNCVGADRFNIGRTAGYTGSSFKCPTSGMNDDAAVKLAAVQTHFGSYLPQNNTATETCVPPNNVRMCTEDQIDAMCTAGQLRSTSTAKAWADANACVLPVYSCGYLNRCVFTAQSIDSTCVSVTVTHTEIVRTTISLTGSPMLSSVPTAVEDAAKEALSLALVATATRALQSNDNTKGLRPNVTRVQAIYPETGKMVLIGDVSIPLRPHEKPGSAALTSVKNTLASDIFGSGSSSQLQQLLQPQLAMEVAKIGGALAAAVDVSASGVTVSSRDLDSGPASSSSTSDDDDDDFPTWALIVIVVGAGLLVLGGGVAAAVMMYTKKGATTSSTPSGQTMGGQGESGKAGADQGQDGESWDGEPNAFDTVSAQVNLPREKTPTTNEAADPSAVVVDVENANQGADAGTE
ncbi:unnamed protein product [Amoebophrya sp. A25]|nr:unnamed protein product [Amoebophrya sp. A25]|eukprot:GSA25T00012548001.1